MLRLLSTSSQRPEAWRSAEQLAALRLCWLAQHEEEQQPDDETRDRDDPKHPFPRRHDAHQLRRDDRPHAETEQRETALLQALVEPAAMRPRRHRDRREARRAVRPFHRAHQRADHDQSHEAACHAGQTGQQREQHDRRDQHLAMPDLVGNPAAEDREHAPCEAERADHVAAVLHAQAEVFSHAERQQRRDDPAVEAHEPEPEPEQRDRFPLVRRIPGTG